MATLLKVRGLQRAGSATADDSGSVLKGRGLRLRSPFKAASTGVKASKTPTAASITLTAKYSGTYGNSIEVATDTTGGPSVDVAFKATTGVPQITVHGPGTASVAANQALVNAVNNHPVASQYVTASLAGAGNAANAIVAMGVLANGTGTGTEAVYVRAHHNATVVVDVDDPKVASALRRSAGNYVVLGGV